MGDRKYWRTQGQESVVVNEISDEGQLCHTGNDETSAEAELRRRVNEEVRAKADAEAVQPAREIVSRGPGKRHATALA